MLLSLDSPTFLMFSPVALDWQLINMSVDILISTDHVLLPLPELLQKLLLISGTDVFCAPSLALFDIFAGPCNVEKTV